MMTKDELAADLALEVTDSGEARLWRNPAAAFGITVHCTWQIQGVPPGKLVIRMKNRGRHTGARFWVGSDLEGWGTDEKRNWEDHLPLFPAGGWTPFDPEADGWTSIKAPKSPFLVVLATDTAAEESRRRRDKVRDAVEAEKQQKTHATAR